MNNVLGDMTEAYTRMAIGEHTHIPLNMIFQGTGDPESFAGVFQFKANPALVKKLLVGADLNRNHVMFIGDAFLRSKIVAQTRALQGEGIAGIYMRGFSDLDKWIRHGKILKGQIENKNG